MGKATLGVKVAEWVWRRMEERVLLLPRRRKLEGKQSAFSVRNSLSYEWVVVVVK